LGELFIALPLKRTVHVKSELVGAGRAKGGLQCCQVRESSLKLALASRVREVVWDTIQRSSERNNLPAPTAKGCNSAWLEEARELDTHRARSELGPVRLEENPPPLVHMTPNAGIHRPGAACRDRFGGMMG